MAVNAVITSPYKVQPSEYALHLMRMWLRRNWPWIALPVTASLALAVAVDLKYIFVAIVVALLVMPHAIFVVWTNHALSPTMRLSILRHSCTLHPDGSITVTFLPDEGDEDSDEAETALPEPVTIPAAGIRRCRRLKRATIYYLASGRYDILIVPHSTLPLR